MYILVFVKTLIAVIKNLFEAADAKRQLRRKAVTLMRCWVIEDNNLPYLLATITAFRRMGL